MNLLDADTIAEILADGIRRVDIGAAFAWPTTRDEATALLSNLAGSDDEGFARGLLALYDLDDRKDTAIS